MKTTKSRNPTQQFIATTLALGAFASGAAWAAAPQNIADTTWRMQINRDAEELVITAQGGPGAPGAANCHVIQGTFGVAEINGWYCPATGRIHFVHTNADSGVAVRIFTGNLSDEVRGQRLFMGGTVTVLNPAFGDLGEYNFAGIN